MKLHLVDDWRRAWRWVSVNCMLLAMIVQGTWSQIPDDLREAVPRSLVSCVTIGLLVLGVAGRLIKQEPKEKS